MASSPPSKPIHLTILIKKLDTLTYPEFHAYWVNEHPKTWLAMPIVKNNVLRYTQFHVDEKVSEGLKAAGMPISEFDGGVHIWGSSVESLMAVFQDPEYLEKVVPDEEKFIDKSQAKIMVGWDEELWKGSEVEKKV